MSRICIYPKDVQVVTGKSERYGRTIIKAIKERLNKEAHQLVTIDEFCDFMGFEISKVQGLIK
ncbi:hypothetical protein N9M11_04610 [Flavobacteriaceae bacterium]|jgi:hypothetical protein|uniref:Uncharacterized protein n=9 Tax=Flavobacteriaceae TaxID=49546 RepID=A0A0A2GS46_9FLAO|nr:MULTISPECIES: hypothetical protein [Flavobacteriaceae]MAL61150.1 hypothetical protein [Flavobacteriaceae bacterium]ANH60726.1 hypothetical protein I597_1824 [Dokdonia donghaensis DSW-1]ARV08381.1 hypothetical protein BTO05_01500 [Winogradskyella sp. PC-19]KGO06002.1 hypothetical protein NV36_03520 [Dokdonia donghaensis DSW-1]MBO3116511.1 hypothetical protein [Winogradskyella sp. DF17]|tara:strand:+ start:555 stop:743 length:189 start_codon:yes stop_codon:yes gene_type:complete